MWKSVKHKCILSLSGVFIYIHQSVKKFSCENNVEGNDLKYLKTYLIYWIKFNTHPISHNAHWLQRFGFSLRNICNTAKLFGCVAVARFIPNGTSEKFSLLKCHFTRNVRSKGTEMGPYNKINKESISLISIMLKFISSSIDVRIRHWNRFNLKLYHETATTMG